MSRALIFNCALAYNMSNSRAWQSDLDGVELSWLPDDGSYEWIPVRGWSV